MSDESGILEVGQEIGQFKVVEKLGAGGMGAVYKGWDEGLQRHVAIKVLPSELAADRSCVKRFQREARSIAALRHPNLMHVYSVGEQQTEAGKIYYFAMEYIEGQSLSAYMAERVPMTLRDTVAILVQIMGALDKVHTNGVVHRDLKPGNVMIDKDGRAILVDFGLSKDTSELGLTGTGTILGTPNYMAPEQIEGAPVGPFTDIYALGIMFYELLTGIKPFQRKSAIMTMRAHCEERPPLVHTRRNDLPPKLSEIVDKAMACKPSDRYADVAALAADLRQITNDPHLEMLAANVKLGPKDETLVDPSTNPTPVVSDLRKQALADAATIPPRHSGPQHKSRHSASPPQAAAAAAVSVAPQTPARASAGPQPSKAKNRKRKAAGKIGTGTRVSLPPPARPKPASTPVWVYALLGVAGFLLMLFVLLVIKNRVENRRLAEERQRRQEEELAELPNIDDVYEPGSLVEPEPEPQFEPDPVSLPEEDPPHPLVEPKKEPQELPLRRYALEGEEPPETGVAHPKVRLLLDDGELLQGTVVASDDECLTLIRVSDQNEVVVPLQAVRLAVTIKEFREEPRNRTFRRQPLERRRNGELLRRSRENNGLRNH